MFRAGHFFFGEKTRYSGHFFLRSCISRHHTTKQRPLPPIRRWGREEEKGLRSPLLRASQQLVCCLGGLGWPVWWPAKEKEWVKVAGVMRKVVEGGRVEGGEPEGLRKFERFPKTKKKRKNDKKVHPMCPASAQEGG